jgi:hypothetical protein
MAAEICESGNITESIANIGSQIRQERKRRGMTQADFAMSVGIGRRAYFANRLMEGKRLNDVCDGGEDHGPESRLKTSRGRKNPSVISGPVDEGITVHPRSQ